MVNSKIEWCDDTWNFLYGCSRISAGCEHCYAERETHRFAGPGQKFEGLTVLGSGGPRFTGKVLFDEKRITIPLKKKKPTRYFVNSMSDLFHRDVPFDVIDKAFAVMALTPQHTYQILTKRPERMREYLLWEGGEKNYITLKRQHLIADAIDKLPVKRPVSVEEGDFYRAVWHGIQTVTPLSLPNVWLGVSVEDQKTADERIPILLDTPAAVRWISAEPLLGAIDLSKWIPQIAPIHASKAPETWDEFPWPDWVPKRVIELIQDFWGPPNRREPKDYLQDCLHQGGPPFGMRVCQQDEGKPDVKGRWIHCWNNIGRIITDEGVAEFASIPRKHLFDNTDYRMNRLHWVVVGGESGHGARPMHPDWARALRDQCVAANVPFFFKQWGEYTWKELGYYGGPTYVSEKVGKKQAGRLLDGVEWNQYPEVAA